jgi:hypothetical protein
MTRGTTEFTQQNSERAMQAATLGMNWAREFAEQSLNQSKVVLDGLFNVTRKMAEEFDDQTTAIREHSTSLIETTLSNTFDFGHKLARLREPQELFKASSYCGNPRQSPTKQKSSVKKSRTEQQERRPDYLERLEVSFRPGPR